MHYAQGALPHGSPGIGQKTIDNSCPFAEHLDVSGDDTAVNEIMGERHAVRTRLHIMNPVLAFVVRNGEGIGPIYLHQRLRDGLAVLGDHLSLDGPSLE